MWLYQPKKQTRWTSIERNAGYHQVIASFLVLRCLPRTTLTVDVAQVAIPPYNHKLANIHKALTPFPPHV